MGNDLFDDLDSMNELSKLILGVPIRVALAPTTPGREVNGRLIQDAQVCQGTDPGLREQLIRIARSRVSESTVEEHSEFVEETLTLAALMGSTLEVARIVESMDDPRFLRWLAEQSS